MANRKGIEFCFNSVESIPRIHQSYDCMKILHLPSSFFPHSMGGKEVFVYQLVKSLLKKDIQSEVLIHSNMYKNYVYDDVKVNVLPALETRNYRRSYFTSIYDNIAIFRSFLKQNRPDIVHFHDQGKGASLSHLRECTELGIKTILTYHSPGQSCLQRAMIFAGTKPCDGKIIRERCTSCLYQQKNIPAYIANMLGKIESSWDPNGKIIHRNRVNLFYDSWIEFYRSIDVIHVYAHWVKELLVQNGIDADKIQYMNMGGYESVSNHDPPHEREPLKLVFVGRVSDIKGIRVLIDAVEEIPGKYPVEVHFFSPPWNSSDFGRKMLARIKDNQRFKQPILVPFENIVSKLREMDACVIPSLWPETGPFTVFDAFAAKIPIIGTNQAGIAERIKHMETGLLFKWNDAKDLRKQIMKLLKNRDLLSTFQKNIGPNRTFQQMGEDIIGSYKKLLG